MTGGQLVTIKAKLPHRFDPQRTRLNNSKADALISHAKRIKDWPLLKQAIAHKIKEQKAFVAWWEKTVTPRHRPGRGKELSADLRLIPAQKAEAATGITHQQVSRWRRRLDDVERYREMLFGTVYFHAMGGHDVIASKWTGNPESYTPAQYIEAARAVMGGIDLDPASNAHANETIKAAIYFDEKTDGLAQQWSGRVFCNPPYSFPEMGQFVDKLCEEFSARNVEQAILLTNNNTDTKWWHRAMRISGCVCFTLGRINFYKEDGEITQPTNGQTFFYFGAQRENFSERFGSFGVIGRGATDVEI